jgi:hypothetical protein
VAGLREKPLDLAPVLLERTLGDGHRGARGLERRAAYLGILLRLFDHRLHAHRQRGDGPAELDERRVRRAALDDRGLRAGGVALHALRGLLGRQRKSGERREQNARSE